MRNPRRQWLSPGWSVVCASACLLLEAQTPPPKSAERVWKPTADWYRPDLRAPKLAPRSVEQSELRFQKGDDPRWAAPDWDDVSWTVIDRARVPLGAGIFWLRLRLRATGPREAIPALVILGESAAVDVFWDGILTRSAGVPGLSRETEASGAANLSFELPAHMAGPGEHVVALRMSTFRSGKMGAAYGKLNLWTVPPDRYRALDAKLNLLPAMGVGAMLTIGISVVVMWILADRRLALALVAALCLSSALLVAVATAPFLLVYSSSWVYSQSAARIALIVLVSSLLPAISMTLLNPGWKRGWLALPMITLAATSFMYRPMEYSALVALLWRIGFGSVILVAAWAIWRRRSGAWPVLAGILVTCGVFEADPKHFESTNYLLGILPLLIGFIAVIALSLRRERIQARDTRLTAARLEIELLKKSLQPHYLMNTLTALSQVVEEKPAAAVRLIEDLASEFRSLSRLSGEKQISLAEELALCRAHLRVMSARTELAWTLDAEGLDDTASIPPALFLTLIENGFSHQAVRKEATAFVLRSAQVGAGVRYTFFSPGAVVPEASRNGGGTGLRYVRARLDESFHGTWSLTQHAIDGGWQTIIELREISGKGRR